MFEAIKKMLSMEAVLIEKFEKDTDLTQEEIDLCLAVAAECNFIHRALDEELPRNMLGRRYRKEGDKYIRDDNGEYKSMRAMGGGIWYHPVNAPVQKSKKFIGPFGS
jgi:hypothetical protein